LLARYVAYVSRKFGNVGKLALLAGGPGRRFAVHGGGEGLMVSVELKGTTFKEKTEVANGKVGGQEFTVESGVLLLGRSQFGREKGKRLPARGSVLLEYSACLGF
jgi:hypothetical protein